MRRRNFVYGAGVGALVCAAGVSAGFYFGVQSVKKSMDLQSFLQRNAGVSFHYLSTELLLKIYSQTLTEVDRVALVHGLVHHNRALFVVDPHGRSLGTPGFYRVIS